MIFIFKFNKYLSFLTCPQQEEKYLGYNLSVASITRIVATLGIAAEMLIIMIIYIKNSLKINLLRSIKNKIFERVVKRVRLKLMTGIVIVSSLLPILHSQEMGSEIISKIVTPMIGDTISSLITALLFIPPIYILQNEKYKKYLNYYKIVTNMLIKCK